jgi:aspartate kinase
MGAGLEIWKFGGAALADARAIQRAADRIVEHDGPLVVVASALAGVTDLLLSADPDASETLRRKHDQAARAIVPAGPARKRLIAEIDKSAREFRDVCAAMRVLGHLSPRALDTLAARGEQLSARLLAAALSAAERRLCRRTRLIPHQRWHGGAAPLVDDAQAGAERCARAISASTIAVVPGFIRPRARWQRHDTLGRGGTDLTATVLARSLGPGR